ncbi:MAG: cyclic nucleotide-binding domain-containing protein [Burkholderiales bacterium]
MNAEEMRVAALRASRLAADLNEDEFSVLAAQVTVRDLTDGEVLVREGASDDNLYVVASGLVGVVKYIETDTKMTVATLNVGDLAGEMSFVDGTSYRSSLVAVGNARVLGLARERLESLLATHPTVVYHVMRAIIRTVHETQRRLAHQAVELSNYIYKQHGRY